MTLIRSSLALALLGRGRAPFHLPQEQETNMADLAEKDTWVEDPTRPGVDVLVRAGDPLPVFPEKPAGVGAAATESADPDRPGVAVVEGPDESDSKAVAAPAENKARKAPAKK